MNPDLHRDIIERLSEYQFKESGGMLRQGKCPNCGQKQLYTNADHPWVLRCGRLNNCGWTGHVKELYPDLFENWSERYQKLEPKNPKAAADAYMRFGRGFDLSKVSGWYTQESHFDRNLNIGSATVRFPVGTGYWERLIDQPHRFGKQKAKFMPGLKYRGSWWNPPSQQLQTVKEIWLVEGIFDAIALFHHDIAAVALLSCNNYPEQALADLKQSRGNQDCKLIWALDGDNAGRRFTRQWVKRAREDGWECYAAQIPQTGKHKLDWNDLHQRDLLTPERFKDFRHHGALLIAKTPAEKALLIYMRDQSSLEFHFEFGQRLYWFKLDLDAFNKAMQMYENDNHLSEHEKRELALASSNTIRRIANCYPSPLYYQANLITDESWYYFRVDFPHDGAPVKNTFSSSQISSAAEFKKRLLGIAPGALYTGTSAMLDRMLEDLENIRRVETVDYIGYSIDHGCYVFGDVAMKDGALHAMNTEDFFDIGKLSIKSLNRSVSLKVNQDPNAYKKEWVNLLWQAFGAKGLAALTFWFGTLFAEQIRARQSSATRSLKSLVKLARANPR